MPPALYAHRLGRAYGPDSSAAALTRVLRRPLEGLETDCCLTADGELVLLHDPLLEVGTTLSGWAHERTAAHILAGRLRHRDGTASDERPLLLDELLELAPCDATLQLEVKAHADPALACRTTRALCERLRDHPARERTEVISFWSGACELAAELGYRARLVAIADYRIHALAAWGQRVGLHGACVEHFLLSRELVATLRAFRNKRHYRHGQPRRNARATPAAWPRRRHKRLPPRATRGAQPGRCRAAVRGLSNGTRRGRPDPGSGSRQQ